MTTQAVAARRRAVLIIPLRAGIRFQPGKLPHPHASNATEEQHLT